MDMSDEARRVGRLDSSTGKSSAMSLGYFLTHSSAFKQECRVLCAADGDATLAAKAYDKAIELYSAGIDLDPAIDSIFARRCAATLGEMI
ncbi:hypothetical protein AZE42_01858 [Rhizopogon vesiculosus]|uniref:Uncharacterized protein n=1 Tax=Rhizopogon vesiculosus TaxID=180088 RepID=A0A1J8QE43_9AGAM|nr:hypothetical protein AZE42_01858 [Rhizopogon vesiculosus]